MKNKNNLLIKFEVGVYSKEKKRKTKKEKKLTSINHQMVTGNLENKPFLLL